MSNKPTWGQIALGLWYDYESGKILSRDGGIGRLTIAALAWALAGTNRYGGWTENFHWSVASHACLVAEIIGGIADYDYLTIFGGLHHDDHESLVGDPTTPYKLSLSPDTRAELDMAARRADAAIWKSLGIWNLLAGNADSSRSAVIRAADLAALEAERKVLFGVRLPWMTEKMVNPKMLEVGERILAGDFGKIRGGQEAADRYMSHHNAIIGQLGGRL